MSTTNNIRNLFVEPKRSCEKYTITYDDGVVVHLTRKEYERQKAQDLLMKSKKKEEEKRAKLCKPKRKFFRKKKVYCSFEQDLTQECVEPNPGPVTGIFTYCHNCSTTVRLVDYMYHYTIYQANCDNCLFMPQSWEYHLNEMNEYKGKLQNWLYDNRFHGRSFLGSYIKIPFQYDSHLNLIEDACLLLYHLVRSRGYTDCTVAIINFCKLRGNRLNLLSTLLEIGDSLFKEQSMTTNFEQDILDRVLYEAQSNPFTELRDKVGVYEKMKELPIYKKMYKLFMYILCSGLLNHTKINFRSLSFDKFEEEAAKRAFKPGCDMIYTIIDSILFVCESGYEYFTTGELTSFLHSGSAYEKWIRQANKLKMQSKFLTNPRPHGIDKFTYLAELKDAIEAGTAINKFAGGIDKTEKLYLSRLLCELQMLEAEEVTKRSAQEPRKDPFGILIHGSSHIAKSKLTEIMFKHYGKNFDLPILDTYRYTRCPTDEYWSGFDSTQWCIVMDDIAFLAPNGEVDPTLKEMLQVKNSVPYTPPQAALEDKGRTPLKAELIIATTNTKHLNLHAYFSCPFAIARRLSYVVTPTVKKQYVKNGFMVDSKKIPPTPEGCYMDIWDFEVSVPMPESETAKDNQRTKYVVIEKFGDINSFLQWYIFVAEEHEISQSKAAKAARTMHDVPICKGCKRTQKECLCSTEWPHLYKDRCNTCLRDKDDCVCDFEAQVETEDFSFMFKTKLWIIHSTIRGDKFDFMQYFLDFYLTWFWTINFMLLGIYLMNPFLNSIIACFLYLFYLFLTNIFIIMRWYMNFTYGSFWKYRWAYSLCRNETEAYVLLFRLAGERAAKVKANRNYLYALGLIIALPTTMIIIRKLLSTWFSQGDIYGKFSENADYTSQGNIGLAPVAQTVEKKTFYYHDPYATTPCEISGASSCAQGNILMELIKRQTARFEIKYPDLGKGMSTTAVNYHGNLWLLNRHSFKRNFGVIDIHMDDVTMNVSRNMSNISFSEKDLHFIDGTDIAIIKLNCMPVGKSILKYFPLRSQLQGVYKGTYVMCNKSGIKSTLGVNNIRAGTCPTFGIPGYHGMVSIPTSVGDCGSLCVVEVGHAQVIFGSHTAGAPHGGIFFQHISQDMLKIPGYASQVSEGEIPISAPGYERKLVDLHNKSSIRFLEQGTAKVYGSFAGYRAKHKSKVEPTLIKEYVEQHGYVGNFGKPDMSWKPWHLAIKDMTTPVHCYLNENIQKCEDAFFEDIIRKLGDKLNLLEVYDLNTALNGADGITYVDKLNASTSAGNPFKKSKKHFITEVDGKITALDPLIMERIRMVEQCYDNNTRYHPQFCGHLKDEPLPTRKIDAGKTRVFTGGEFAWCVVVRRYLLSHIRLIQNNPFVFEAMPGVVAQSIEWQNLYNYLIAHGEDQIVAGDYGKFDKRMAAPFILSAFRILERLAAKAGWSEEDLTYIRCIAQDTAFPCIDFNGDLVEIQGNPSGHPLTVIINCLVNSLYMRYAYLLISGKPLKTFQDNVSLATYGDDNIMGISRDCPNFNHTRIAIAMKCIGVEYTMAEKDAASVPYIHISQSSFLKRAFVFDKDIGAIVAPLDESSFHKMLTYRLPKADMASEAHAICVIETAQREYFFHGKDKFDDRQAFFRQLVIDMNLQDWVRDSTFPNYYEMVHEFWMKYDDIKNANRFALRE